VSLSFKNLNLVFVLHNDEFRCDELLLLGFLFIFIILETWPPMIGTSMYPHPPWISLKFGGCLHISSMCVSLLPHSVILETLGDIAPNFFSPILFFVGNISFQISLHSRLLVFCSCIVLFSTLNFF
jgi:hypothetical protein